MRKLILFSVAWIILTGCKLAHQELSFAEGTVSYTTYATGFDVSDQNMYKVLEIFNPWQNSRNITFSYVLARDKGLVPDSLRDLPFIKIPVQNVITLSTTHVAMIEQLGMAATIQGASGAHFIYNAFLKEKVRSGELKEVGHDQGLNYETIVHLNPDVLFLYGVEGSVMAIAEKLSELRIPVVYCGDYLEPHPLGKAEWIKFFSLFYGMEKQADVLFHQIDSTYQSLSSLTSGVSQRPRVLTGLPWKDTWYMAGGKSYAAKLIEDAGGDFLWNDNPSTQAIPMDLESVYARAVEADVWINPGAATNLKSLGNFDERFQALPVLTRGEVYNNDLRVTEAGGNDYWESGSVRPDQVLADLIALFHPDLLSDHRYIYYRKLK